MTSARADLALRRSTLVRGSFAVVGNAVVDCPTNASCANNTSILTFVDRDAPPLSDLDGDGDDDTQGSSSATLVLPTGAVVSSATLYVGAWAADASTNGPFGPGWVVSPPVPSEYGVLFAPPGVESYTALVPAEVKVVDVAEGYQARYDVTSLVTGPGKAWVANPRISPATHPYHRTSWWTLVVVYEDGGPTKLINLYDGVIRCSNNTTVNTLGGFRTPATGSVVARFSSWCEDGLASIAGESITIGTKTLSNAQNPSNNIGNSSVSDPSGAITRDPMSFRVSESVDIDSFDATGAFTNGQESATVTFKCGAQEGVYYHGAVLAFDVLAPTVSVTKTVTPAGPVEPDAELEYTITVTVSGADDAVDVIVRDTIPAGSSYVAGSLVVVDGAAAGSKTDDAGDDEAERTGDGVVVRVGVGADSTDGGEVAVGQSRSVKFRVRAGQAGASIRNVAAATFRAATGGAEAPQTTVLSNEVTTEVAMVGQDLSPGEPDLASTADLAAPSPADLAAPEDLVALDLAGSVDGSGTQTPADLRPGDDDGKPQGGCSCRAGSGPAPDDDARGVGFALACVGALLVARARRGRSLGAGARLE